MFHPEIDIVAVREQGATNFVSFIIIIIIIIIYLHTYLLTRLLT